MSLTSFITDAVGLWKQRPPLAVERNPKTDHSIDVSAAPPDTRRLIRNGQYCRVLANEGDMPFDDLSVECAWRALEQEMALVPGGDICLINDTIVSSPNGFEVVASPDEILSVDSFLSTATASPTPTTLSLCSRRDTAIRSTGQRMFCRTSCNSWI